MLRVRKPPMSARGSLRAFHSIRGHEPDAGFMADLVYLQNRDVDLSVRLGVLLTFDVLMVAAAINLISAPLARAASSTVAGGAIAAVAWAWIMFANMSRAQAGAGGIFAKAQLAVALPSDAR